MVWICAIAPASGAENRSRPASSTWPGRWERWGCGCDCIMSIPIPMWTWSSRSWRKASSCPIWISPSNTPVRASSRPCAAPPRRKIPWRGFSSGGATVPISVYAAPSSSVFPARPRKTSSSCWPFSKRRALTVSGASPIPPWKAPPPIPWLSRWPRNSNRNDLNAS